MNTSIYVRGLWLAVMAGLVVVLSILLVLVSFEARQVAAELERRVGQEQVCAAALRTRMREVRVPVPRARGWTVAEERQLQAQVQAIVEPHDGKRRP
jgi:hypothetical protein